MLCKNQQYQHIRNSCIQKEYILPIRANSEKSKYRIMSDIEKSFCKKHLTNPLFLNIIILATLW